MVAINVAQLLKSPIGTTRTLHVDEETDFSGQESVVTGDLQLVRTDRAILVKGTLKSDIQLTCSRCLKLFTCTVKLDIEEEYFPSIDIQTGAPMPKPEDPDAFTIDQQNILDLTEAIRQYGLLAIPMKPLCREDCAGLCPTCGANLNEVSCTCSQPAKDPRWSRLTESALATDETPGAE